MHHLTTHIISEQNSLYHKQRTQIRHRTITLENLVYAIVIAVAGGRILLFAFSQFIYKISQKIRIENNEEIHNNNIEVLCLYSR